METTCTTNLTLIHFSRTFDTGWVSGRLGEYNSVSASHITHLMPGQAAKLTRNEWPWGVRRLFRVCVDRVSLVAVRFRLGDGERALAFLGKLAVQLGLGETFSRFLFHRVASRSIIELSVHEVVYCYAYRWSYWGKAHGNV